MPDAVASQVGIFPPEEEKAALEQLKTVICAALAKIGVYRAASKTDQWHWQNHTHLADDLAPEIYGTLSQLTKQALLAASDQPMEHLEAQIATSKLQITHDTLERLLAFLRERQPLLPVPSSGSYNHPGEMPETYHGAGMAPPKGSGPGPWR